MKTNINEGNTIVADLNKEKKDKLKFDIRKKSKPKKAKEEQN